MKEHWILTSYKTIAMGAITLMVGMGLNVLVELKTSVAVIIERQTNQQSTHDNYEKRNDSVVNKIGLKVDDNEKRIVTLEGEHETN